MKFRRVGSALHWHDALRPLLKIARFLPASWPVQWSSVEVTSKFRSGFNRHQPVLENLSATPLFAFSTCQCFTGYPRGNFFVMARSASVALGEVGLVFHVLLLEYASTFLLCLVPILVPFFPPFVHFLLCFYRKENITFLTSLTTIMINPLSNKKTFRKML